MTTNPERLPDLETAREAIRLRMVQIEAIGPNAYSKTELLQAFEAAVRADERRVLLAAQPDRNEALNRIANYLVDRKDEGAFNDYLALSDRYRMAGEILDLLAVQSTPAAALEAAPRLVEAVHEYENGHLGDCPAEWPRNHGIEARPCKCGYDALMSALSDFEAVGRAATAEGETP